MSAEVERRFVWRASDLELVGPVKESGRAKPWWELLREDYNPDEARDEQGKWTSGGVLDAAQVVADRVAAGGGATINMRTGEQPATGYPVALGTHSLITPRDSFTKQTFVDWFVTNRAVFTEGVHAGVWSDVKNNEVVLDPSQVLADKSEAQALGASRDQQSIWDLANNQEIPTGGTGGRGG